MLFNAFRTISAINCKSELIAKKQKEEADTINCYDSLIKYQGEARQSLEAAKEKYLDSSNKTYQSLIGFCDNSINSCLHYLLIKLDDQDEELSNYYCLCCQKEVCLKKSEVDDNKVVNIDSSDIDFVKENIDTISDNIFNIIKLEPQIEVSRVNELITTYINSLKPNVLTLKKGE